MSLAVRKKHQRLSLSLATTEPCSNLKWPKILRLPDCLQRAICRCLDINSHTAFTTSCVQAYHITQHWSSCGPVACFHRADHQNLSVKSLKKWLHSQTTHLSTPTVCPDNDCGECGALPRRLMKALAAQAPVLTRLTHVQVKEVDAEIARLLACLPSIRSLSVRSHAWEFTPLLQLPKLRGRQFGHLSHLDARPRWQLRQLTLSTLSDDEAAWLKGMPLECLISEEPFQFTEPAGWAAAKTWPLNHLQIGSESSSSSYRVHDVSWSRADFERLVQCMPLLRTLLFVHRLYYLYAQWEEIQQALHFLERLPLLTHVDLSGLMSQSLPPYLGTDDKTAHAGFA